MSPIKNDLNKNNVCVIEVKKFPHKIYVYDIKYDILDARLYSLDEDLSRFHHHQNTMELSPMGDFLGYGSLSFIGTLDNHHAFDLMRMGIGISDLVSNGFFVSISDNDIHQNEVLRRRLERKIREDLLKKAGALGIDVISFRINELSVKENDDKVLSKTEHREGEIKLRNGQTEGNLHIENKPAFIITVPTIHGHVKQIGITRRFFILAVFIIGLVASVVTIFFYFGFDLDIVKNNIHILFETLDKELMNYNSVTPGGTP